MEVTSHQANELLLPLLALARWGAALANTLLRGDIVPLHLGTLLWVLREPVYPGPHLLELLRVLGWKAGELGLLRREARWELSDRLRVLLLALVRCVERVPAAA